MSRWRSNTSNWTRLPITWATTPTPGKITAESKLHRHRLIFYFTVINIEVNQFRTQPCELPSPVLRWLVDVFKIVTEFCHDIIKLNTLFCLLNQTMYCTAI